MVLDFQKKKAVAGTDTFLLMRCATRHDGRRVAETEGLKLSFLSYTVTIVVPRDFLLVLIVKSIISFSAAFEKYHGVSFLDARMVDII